MHVNSISEGVKDSSGRGQLTLYIYKSAGLSCYAQTVSLTFAVKETVSDTKCD